MKIISTSKPKSLPMFGDIKLGDVFALHNGEVYIKSAGTGIATKLETGINLPIDVSTTVTPYPDAVLYLDGPPSPMEWIPVTDAPHPIGKVIIYRCGDGMIDIAKWRGNQKSITHWLPLTALPPVPEVE